MILPDPTLYDWPPAARNWPSPAMGTVNTVCGSGAALWVGGLVRGGAKVGVVGGVLDEVIIFTTSDAVLLPPLSNFDHAPTATEITIAVESATTRACL